MKQIAEMTGSEVVVLFTRFGYSLNSIADKAGLACSTVWAMANGSSAQERTAEALRRAFRQEVEHRRSELKEMEGCL